MEYISIDTTPFRITYYKKLTHKSTKYLYTFHERKTSIRDHKLRSRVTIITMLIKGTLYKRYNDTNVFLNIYGNNTIR